jgi:diaminobutyrate-2-oxoglutarate transaminase
MLDFAERGGGEVRGRGMIHGVEFADKSLAGKVSRAAFERGLVIETAGPSDEVLKALPPLTIEPADLEAGLEIVAASLQSALATGRKPTSPSPTVVAREISDANTTTNSPIQVEAN